MTEDEANTKWCPQVGYTMWSNSVGRFGLLHRALIFLRIMKKPDKGVTCIGSACMAWRWDVGANRQGPKVDHGYCGLAGKT